MEREFTNYKTWEDAKMGMYETTCFMDQENMILECETLLKCPEWLEEAMKFCAFSWKNSANHHLTNIHRNRQAWLGQAACCMTHGAPEYITKIAWGRLKESQQKIANTIADEIIKTFEELKANEKLFEQKRSRSH